MRTRRRFQPTLDGMPARIAPSSMAIGRPVVSMETTQTPSAVVIPLSPVVCSTDPNDPTDPPS